MYEAVISGSIATFKPTCLQANRLRTPAYGRAKGDFKCDLFIDRPLDIKLRESGKVSRISVEGVRGIAGDL